MLGHFLNQHWNFSQTTCRESSSSSSSSHSESEEDVPIANLKRPPRRQIIEESSDEEDNVPLSELGKGATQSTLSSQSSDDEDMNKEEWREEMSLTWKSHGVG
jgi:hypothetical protein